MELAASHLVNLYHSFFMATCVGTTRHSPHYCTRNCLMDTCHWILYYTVPSIHQYSALLHQLPHCYLLPGVCGLPHEDTGTGPGNVSQTQGNNLSACRSRNGRFLDLSLWLDIEVAWPKSPVGGKKKLGGPLSLTEEAFSCPCSFQRCVRRT